jgi:hypothetical protein
VTSRNDRVLYDAYRCFHEALELIENTPDATFSTEKARLYQKLSDVLSMRARLGNLQREQRSKYLKDALMYNSKLIELAESLDQYPIMRLQALFERARLIAQEVELEAQGRVSGATLLGLRLRRDSALEDLSKSLEKLRDVKHENILTFQQQEEWHRRRLSAI